MDIFNSIHQMSSESDTKPSDSACAMAPSLHVNIPFIESSCFPFITNSTLATDITSAERAMLQGQSLLIHRTSSAPEYANDAELPPPQQLVRTTSAPENNLESLPPSLSLVPPTAVVPQTPPTKVNVPSIKDPRKRYVCHSGEPIKPRTRYDPAVYSAFRGFDKERGVEVTWHQFKVGAFTQSQLVDLMLELGTLKTLNHPCILGIKDGWVEEKLGLVMIVTDIISAGTCIQAFLERVSSTGKLLTPDKVMRRWTHQLCSALKYLHEHIPAVHTNGSLLCTNIYMNGNKGDIRLGIFGMIKAFKMFQVCKNNYMAPELVYPSCSEEGALELVLREADTASDIYVLGTVVLELVTRELPFAECYCDMTKLYNNLVQQVHPQSFGRLTPGYLRDFISKCWMPKDSRPTAAELLSEMWFENMQEESPTNRRAALKNTRSLSEPIMYDPLARPISHNKSASADTVTAASAVFAPKTEPVYNPGVLDCPLVSHSAGAPLVATVAESCSGRERRGSPADGSSSDDQVASPDLSPSLTGRKQGEQKKSRHIRHASDGSLLSSMSTKVDAHENITLEVPPDFFLGRSAVFSKSPQRDEPVAADPPVSATDAVSPRDSPSSGLNTSASSADLMGSPTAHSEGEAACVPGPLPPQTAVSPSRALALSPSRTVLCLSPSKVIRHLDSSPPKSSRSENASPTYCSATFDLSMIPPQVDSTGNSSDGIDSDVIFFKLGIVYHTEPYECEFPFHLRTDSSYNIANEFASQEMAEFFGISPSATILKSEDISSLAANIEAIVAHVRRERHIDVIKGTISQQSQSISNVPSLAA